MLFNYYGLPDRGTRLQQSSSDSDLLSTSSLNPSVPEFTPGNFTALTTSPPKQQQQQQQPPQQQQQQQQQPTQRKYNIPHSSEIRPQTQIVLSDISIHLPTFSQEWDGFFFASLSILKNGDKQRYAEMQEKLSQQHKDGNLEPIAETEPLRQGELQTRTWRTSL
jgi:hypothetical protein